MARLYTVKSYPSPALPFAARKGGGEDLPLPFGVAKG